jgi:hypothetical protein
MVARASSTARAEFTATSQGQPPPPISHQVSSRHEHMGTGCPPLTGCILGHQRAITSNFDPAPNRPLIGHAKAAAGPRKQKIGSP